MEFLSFQKTWPGTVSSTTPEHALRRLRVLFSLPDVGDVVNRGQKRADAVEFGRCGPKECSAPRISRPRREMRIGMDCTSPVLRAWTQASRSAR